MAAAVADAAAVVVVAVAVVVDTVVHLADQNPVLVADIPDLVVDNSDSVGLLVVDTVDSVAAAAAAAAAAAEFDSRAAVAACVVPELACHLARYYQRLDCPRLPSPSPVVEGGVEGALADGHP